MDEQIFYACTLLCVRECVGAFLVIRAAVENPAASYKLQQEKREGEGERWRKGGREREGIKFKRDGRKQKVDFFIVREDWMCEKEERG